MNFATHFYVGSLTVIGLFIFYRLIQKTRWKIINNINIFTIYIFTKSFINIGLR
jgi:hypothetical protein